MKRIFLIGCFLLCGYFSSDVMANHIDSVQALKLKIEAMEKQVQQLQAEIQTLRSTDSSLTAELQSIKKAVPGKQLRKLVIDRRGSKQAYLQ
jgi:predicted  nucleic acid-binding Zn-ribbon protein